MAQVGVQTLPIVKDFDEVKDFPAYFVARGWSALGEYSTASTCQWTPTVAGTYQVKVVGRDVGTDDEVMDDEIFEVTP